MASFSISTPMQFNPSPVVTPPAPASFNPSPPEAVQPTAPIQPLYPPENTPGQGARTDRNNNPTAMTTAVAQTLGMQLGKDYVPGDPFSGGVTAKLIGNPYSTTISALTNTAQADPNGNSAFYTQSGQPRWSYPQMQMTNAQWLAQTPAQQFNTITQSYKQEGGSGSLTNTAQNFVNNVTKGRQMGASDTDILNSISAQLPNFGSVLAQARQMDPNDSDILNFLSEKYSGQQSQVPANPVSGSSQTSSSGQEPGLLSDVGNFLNNAAKSIVTPIVKTAMAPVQIAKGLVDLAAGGGSEAAQSKAAADLGPQNIPWLGSVTPVGGLNAQGQSTIPNLSSFVKQVVGTGLQVGSLAGGGEGALEEGATREAVPFFQRIVEGAASGAKVAGLGGAAQGAGQALMNPNATGGSVLGGAALGGIGGALTGGALGGVLGGAIPNTAADIPVNLDEGPVGATPASMQAVDDMYSKAIQPSMSGMTKPGVANAMDEARQAVVHAIVGNSEDLGLSPGQFPTLSQMPEVVNNLSQKVFSSYNAIQQASGLGTNATIDLNPIADQLEAEVETMAQSPLPRLQSAANNAQLLVENLRNTGSMTFQEAQDAMAQMNAAFKTYKMSSDPLIAAQGAAERKLYNYLGDELGSKVEEASGTDYTGLRKLYAQIKSVMPEIQKAANKADAGGIASKATFFDHLMDGEIGLTALHGNIPGALGGIATKVIKGAINNANLPDAVLQRMFQAVEDSAGDTLPSLEERTMAGVQGAISNAMTRKGAPLALPMGTIEAGSGVESGINPARVAEVAAQHQHISDLNTFNPARALPAGNSIQLGEPDLETQINANAQSAGVGSTVAPPAEPIPPPPEEEPPQYPKIPAKRLRGK